MKKILAIVLTLAMLLSMVAVGTSAATREVTQDESTENHYWMFQAGNSWHPVKFSNPSSTVEMDIRLDDADSELSCYNLSNAPSIGAGYVGLKDGNTKVDYTFEVGTWYTVKWVSAGGSTEIFVNGASVGTVGAELSYYDGNQFYWAPKLVSMDNVKVGGQTFDFEGDNSAWNSESAQGMLQAIEIPGAVHNNLVYSYNEVKSEKKAYSHNIAADNEGQYMYITGVPTTSKAFSRISFDVYFTSEDGTLFGADYLGAKQPQISPKKIGNVDLTTPLTLNTWHHISIESYLGNNAAFFKVDGGDASVSNYDGLIGNYFNTSTICCAGKWGAVTNILFEESDDAVTYTTVASEDFSDGAWNNFGSTEGNGVITTIVESEEKTVSEDLGLKYWHFQAGNSWHPVKFNNPSSTVELDICLDDADSELSCYNLSNAPSIGAGYVGLKDGNTKVNYTFKPGTWYNVKWVSANGKTEIFVDGASAGTVNGELSYYDGNQFYWAPKLLSMDNVRVGGQTFDFEGDNAAWNTESVQGECLEYILKSETIFDKIPAPEVTGECVALSSPYDATSYYYDISSMAGSGKDMILDFNLKLLPEKNARIADEQTNHWFEFWLDNGCQNRVCIAVDAVGVQRKNTNDWTAFDFGADRWHRVTVEVLGSYNTIRIYIDTELIYEGTCGEVHWLDGKFLIGNVWNTNAIINNYNIYANKTYEKINTSFSDVESKATERRLELDNLCVKGHFPGETVITTAETCYSTGIDTTTCAVCGEKIEHVVPEFAHKWSSYSISTKNDDGLVYNECRNSNGCTARHYTTIPANYSGTLYQYYDMSDDFVLNCNSGWSADYWTAEDGVLKFQGSKGTNYNQFDLNQNIDANNWSWFMDIAFNGTFDTGDTAKYGHVAYFWCGGSDGLLVQAGYDFDNGEFFIRPDASKGTPFKAKTAKVALEAGKTYNFGITFEYDEEEYTGAVKLWLDNEVVCSFTEEDDEDIIFNIPYGSAQIHYIIWRVFGVEHNIDAMGIGTADYSTFSNVLGDVDGDWTISAADAVAYRRFFSAQADAINLAKVAVADMNNDGAVNAKDLLALRIALAA